MRFIGIQHRVKISADEELRPTRVAIIDGGAVRQLELETEQDELDFILGIYNGADGLHQGDTVAMVLGGSGDYLAFALARRADEVGASVVRVPSFVLKRERTAHSSSAVRFGEPEPKPKKRGRKKEPTEEDDVLLATLARDKPSLFYPLADRDRDLILVRERWRALWEAMQARMACSLRLRQYFIGRLFTQPTGLFPEGGIEKAFDTAKASDSILAALEEEEAKRERELEKALKGFALYEQVFMPVEGMGPKIAARLIAAIVDIRRFETDAQLKAFCGVHVLPDGRFARQRTGEVANWHGDARQALVLFADQANKRPNIRWGKYLRQMKEKLRAKHPKPVKVEVPDKETGGTKWVTRYSDGHIHQMARWRTSTRFVEWLHKRWWRFERGEPLEVKRQAA